MFCPYCGNSCDDSHRFCYRCGNPLPELPLHAAEAQPEPIPESAIPEPQPVVETPAPEIIAQTDEFPTDEPQALDESTEEIPAESTPATAKGRLWPPVLILGIVACFGLVVYFLSNFTASPAPQSATPWFSVSNGELTFHQEYYTGEEELVIPAVVDGQTVSAIADYAFSGCDRLSTVVLPNTVIRIGDYAFSGCEALRGIYIPSSVKLIGNYAFADCNAMEAIYIPGNLERMGNEALNSCDTLRFILFDGTCAQWNELYSGRFVTEVELHATDGVFYARP